MIVAAEFFLYPRPNFLGAYVRLVDWAILGMSVAVLFRWLQRRYTTSLMSDATNHVFSGDSPNAEPNMLIPLGISGLGAPVLTLLAATVVSAIFAFHFGLAVKKTIQQAELVILVYLTAVATRDKKTHKQVLLLILGMSVFEAVFGAVQYITNTGGIPMPGGLLRVSGTLGNDLAGYLLIGVVVGLAFLAGTQAQKRVRFWSLIMATGLVGAVLIITQVRGAWISFALIFFSMFLFYSSQWKRMLAVLLFTAMFVVGLWAGQGALGVHTFVRTLENRGLTTIGVRFLLWKAAANMWWKHPWLGVGPGNYGTLFTEQSLTGIDLRPTVELYHLSPEIDTHSAFFTRLAEGGILGVAANLWLLLSALIIAWRLYSGGSSLGTVNIRDLSLRRLLSGPGTHIEVGGIAAFIIMLISLPAYFYSGPPGGKLFWVALGLLMRTDKNTEHNKIDFK